MGGFCFNVTKRLARSWLCIWTKGQLKFFVEISLSMHGSVLFSNIDQVLNKLMFHWSYMLAVCLNDTMPWERRVTDFLILRNDSIAVFPILTHTMICTRQWKNSSWGKRNSGIFPSVATILEILGSILHSKNQIHFSCWELLLGWRAYC